MEVLRKAKDSSVNLNRTAIITDNMGEEEAKMAKEVAILSKTKYLIEEPQKALKDRKDEI